MKIEQRVPPDRWLFAEAPRECTSCGILVHTGRLEKRHQNETSILLVEQMDVPGRPWGIPAGRVEHYETDPKETALRELREETGLALPPERLSLFCELPDPQGKIKIIYRLPITFTDIGTCRYTNGVWFLDRKEGPEIGRIALVPVMDLFRRGDSLITDYYRWDVWHEIKAALEGLSVI